MLALESKLLPTQYKSPFFLSFLLEDKAPLISILSWLPLHRDVLLSLGLGEVNLWL